MSGETLFWRPCCPACGDVATDRIALGDGSGPQPRPAGEVACDACGETFDVAQAPAWQPTAPQA